MLKPYKEDAMHMHIARRTHQTSTHMLVAFENHKLSLQSPPGSMGEWWGSNTPVTLVSLLVTIHGVDQSY